MLSKDCAVLIEPSVIANLVDDLALVCGYEVFEDVPECHDEIPLDTSIMGVSSVRIPHAPPVQRPQTCSAGIEAASGPAPRGAFCFGLLTTTFSSSLGKSSQTPFALKPDDFVGLGFGS